jgi:multiple sugar transport system substrate-binding protein
MKYLFIIVLVLSIIICVLIGCSPYVLYLPSRDEQVNQSESIDLNKTIKVFENLKTASSDANNINIVMMNGPEADSAKELAEEFEKIYGIKATIYDAGWGEIKKNIATPLSGIGFDVFPIDIIVFPGYSMGEIQRYLKDLDTYIEKDNLDLADLFPDIFQTVAKWKGSIKALPLSYSINTVIYREDLLEENNIAVKNDWSQKEYYEYIEKLGSDGRYKILLDPLKLNIYWLNRFINLGGKTATGNWEVTVDNEYGYKSLDMLKSFIKYSPEDILQKQYNEIVMDFVKGDFIFFEDTPDFLFTNHEEIADSGNYDNIGILPAPSGPGGNFTILESKLIGITKNSDKADKAWNWVKYYIDSERSAMLLDKYGILPARISAYENNELNDKYIFLEEVYKLLKEANFKTRWNIQGSYEIFEVMLNDKLNNGISENSNSADTMKEIESEWKEILRLKPPSPDIKNLE